MMRGKRERERGKVPGRGRVRGRERERRRSREKGRGRERGRRGIKKGRGRERGRGVEKGGMRIASLADRERDREGNIEQEIEWIDGGKIREGEG